MRRMLLASAAVFALTAPAHAQVGACTTAGGLPCASLTEQGVQYAEQIVQEAQEAITAVQEVTNTISLTATVFNDLTSTVQQIMTTARRASMLIGLSGQMLAGIQTPGGYRLAMVPIPCNGINLQSMKPTRLVMRCVSPGEYCPISQRWRMILRI